MLFQCLLQQSQEITVFPLQTIRFQFLAHVVWIFCKIFGTFDMTVTYDSNSCIVFFVLSNSPSSWCRDNYIHWRAVKMAMNIHEQLKSILTKQMQVRFFFTSWLTLKLMKSLNLEFSIFTSTKLTAKRLHQFKPVHMHYVISLTGQI